MLMVEQHEVRDGSRIIRFQGTLLASASSERPVSPRYVTLTLFSLPSPPPAYVLSRVQYSRVFHVQTCEQAIRNHLPLGVDSAARNLPLTSLSPCQYCNPGPANPEAPDFKTTHRFEVPRHFGAIIDTPGHLLSALAHPSTRPSRAHTLEPPHNNQLPWLSRQLVDAAAPLDPALQAAYNVVIP
jgi:hypothetical protein